LAKIEVKNGVLVAWTSRTRKCAKTTMYIME